MKKNNTMKISEHISKKEVCHSFTARRLGIDNCPPDELWNVIRHTSNVVFEPLRIAFDIPIKINSFYRSVKLNRRIGGSARSQHCKGEAIDIDDAYSLRYGVTNSDFFYWLKKHVDFDQLIWEFGNDENPAWVHVSCKPNVRRNRRQVLRSVRKNRRVYYEVF